MYATKAACEGMAGYWVDFTTENGCVLRDQVDELVTGAQHAARQPLAAQRRHRVDRRRAALRAFELRAEHALGSRRQLVGGAPAYAVAELHYADWRRLGDDALRSEAACRAASCQQGMLPFFFAPDVVARLVAAHVERIEAETRSERARREDL